MKIILELGYLLSVSAFLTKSEQVQQPVGLQANPLLQANPMQQMMPALQAMQQMMPAMQMMYPQLQQVAMNNEVQAQVQKLAGEFIEQGRKRPLLAKVYNQFQAALELAEQAQMMMTPQVQNDLLEVASSSQVQNDLLELAKVLQQPEFAQLQKQLQDVVFAQLLGGGPQAMQMMNPQVLFQLAQVAMNTEVQAQVQKLAGEFIQRPGLAEVLQQLQAAAQAAAQAQTMMMNPQVLFQLEQVAMSTQVQTELRKLAEVLQKQPEFAQLEQEVQAQVQKLAEVLQQPEFEELLYGNGLGAAAFAQYPQYEPATLEELPQLVAVA